MEMLLGHAFEDRVITLVIALTLSLVCFGPISLYRALGLHVPGRWVRGFVKSAERKLNRENRTAGTLVYRGIILVMFCVVLSLMFALVVNWVSLNWRYGIYIEIVLIAYIIPARHLLDRVRLVSQAMRKKNVTRAQKIASTMARREHGTLDIHSISRVSIEYLIENFADKVVAPLCWYLVIGFPGLVVQRMINLLDSHVGHKSPKYIAFGWASARLDDVLQWIPARLSAVFLFLASFFVPKSKPFRSLAMIARDASKTTSPNSGWPLAAAAGALNITLAGPRRVADGTIEDAWIGQGTPKTQVKDLIRSQWLYATANVMLLLFLVVGLLVLSKTV